MVELATVGMKRDLNADDFVADVGTSVVHLAVVVFGAPKLPASGHLPALHRKDFPALYCLESQSRVLRIATVLVLYPEGT